MVSATMNMRKLFLPALRVGGVIALTRWRFTKSATTKPIANSSSYDAIDAYIERQRRRLNIPGMALAIVQGDKIAHLRGFGKARPHGQAPTPQTPFFIGSLTKSFTALAVMQLVEARKVELDAPVQCYLPWFRVADPQASAQITVRHLLNQTSGLPMSLGLAGLADFDNRSDAAERQVRALSTFKLTRPVGAKFEYTNTNYNVLGLIIETVSGEPYSEYIQQHIFNPLDMDHSYTCKSAAQQNGLAVGHRYWFGHPIPAPNLLIPLGSLPSGQLISCAEDMAHYLIANLNGGRYGDAQILSPVGIKELHRSAAEMNEMGLALGYYGMGWISQGTGASRIVWHSGIVPNFGAFMALAPEQNKGMALLFNVNHAMMKLTFDEIGMGAALRLAGQPPSPTRLGAAPWAMRGMLLIPLLQIVGVVAALRRLRRGRANLALGPNRARIWGQHILLPLLPNLLAALTLIPMFSKMRGFIKLFMADYYWMAASCGSLAIVWSVLRTALVVRAHRKR